MHVPIGDWLCPDMYASIQTRGSLIRGQDQWNILSLETNSSGRLPKRGPGRTSDKKRLPFLWNERTWWVYNKTTARLNDFDHPRGDWKEHSHGWTVWEV